jgi:O-acetylhomoserine/O-acetylserine sulfhydrylase-like pyridoxal-dependent enzyme
MDPTDYERFDAAVDVNTRAIYCKTVANPSFNITDIEKVSEVT